MWHVPCLQFFLRVAINHVKFMAAAARFAFILSAFCPELASNGNVTYCEMFINTQGQTEYQRFMN